MNEWNWNANKMTSSRECETIVTDIQCVYTITFKCGWHMRKPNLYVTFQPSTSSSIRMHWSVNFFLHFSRFFSHQFFPKWLIMMTIDNWFNLPQYVHALIVSRSSIPTINMPKCIKIWKIKINKIKLKIVCRNNNSTDYDMVNTNWIYLTENKMLLSELR